MHVDPRQPDPRHRPPPGRARRDARAARFMMPALLGLLLLPLLPLLPSCGGGGGDGPPVPLPQTVTLTSPANFADGIDGTVTLTASAAANAGIVAVEFQVDGVAVGGEDTTAPYSTTIDATQWASGQHVLRARGRDAAGSRTAWSSAVVRFGGGRVVPAGFTRNEGFIGGFNAPVAFAQAPDGRFFVAEQGGNVRVVKNGALLGSPFVTLSVDANGERGLVGITVHPQFASNGFVYVYYTRINGVARNNRISRFVANGDVVTSPAQKLLDLPDLSSTATNHSGGGLRFGADGKLYVGVGDNGNGALAQNIGHPFGKILRLNDDGSVPEDNPFATTTIGLGRYVWANGLRNPFTLAIQPGSGRMHINDVGQETWEEINLGAPGANYGWPTSEGPTNVGAFTGPIFAYGHAPASPAGSGPGGFFIGQAIAGGTFYPTNGPGLFPAPYRGNYFFADFVSRFIGVLDINNGNAAYAFGSVSALPVDMLVGTDGALYVLTRIGITRFSTP